MGAQRDKGSADASISHLAANQHGVVSAAQLERAGIRRRGRGRRVAASHLHPIHRGVYAVGHRKLSSEGRWMAAVLASGEGAVLSHTSAAELWGIWRRYRSARSDERVPVHTTVPTTAGKRQRTGIVLHRSSSLIARHCTRRDGIPVTTPARTLADVRSLLSPAQFASAIREAEFRRLPLENQERGDGARSELEARMLAICRRHRLPQPCVNVLIDRYVVDFLWPGASLIVEVDGWTSHRTRSAFEEDRARDARLAVLGYEVVRFTWRQVTGDGRAVAATIRALLRGRS